jgi:hypothetical protein
MQSMAPDGVEKVSKFFADKKMSRDSIENGVKEALTNKEEEEKLAQLEVALQKVIHSCETIDQGNPDWFTLSMKETHSRIKEPNLSFELVVKLYDHVLRDLLDKATYTPPKEGEPNWTRRVDDLTNLKSNTSSF